MYTAADVLGSHVSQTDKRKSCSSCVLLGETAEHYLVFGIMFLDLAHSLNPEKEHVELVRTGATLGSSSELCIKAENSIILQYVLKTQTALS